MAAGLMAGMCRDQLRQNALVKQYFCDIDIAHLISYNEELAHRLTTEPADIIPLVWLAIIYTFWVRRLVLTGSSLNRLSNNVRNGSCSRRNGTLCFHRTSCFCIRPQRTSRSGTLTPRISRISCESPGLSLGRRRSRPRQR